jgi:deoxyguanosine kinase
VQEDLFARGGVVSDYLFAKDRLFATLNLSPHELTLYDKFHSTLAPHTVTPDLVVYLQARTEVLMERVLRRGHDYERPIRFEYLRDVAAAYADLFFSYNDSPLLIVNTSDIDYEHDLDDRKALIDVIRRTHSGINHWSRS